MTDREKLVELLCNGTAKTETCNLHQDCATAKGDCRFCTIMADHLIANGVTVQEWIPVSESPKENGIYCVMVENYKSRKVKQRTHARYRNGRWLDLYDDWENRCWHVTHWMPPPQPPKGE